MIYQTLSCSQFITALAEHHMTAKFSMDASRELYNYYRGNDDDLTYELDCVAISCEWDEYDTLGDLVHDYKDTILEIDPETNLNSAEDVICTLTECAIVIQLDNYKYLSQTF